MGEADPEAVRKRLAEIRKRADHTNDKWNILLAQSDRTWLMKQVEILLDEVEAARQKEAAMEQLSASIRKTEDGRILAEVASNA